MYPKGLLVGTTVWAWCWIILGSLAQAQPAASPLARAVDLMKNRQYNDAVKVLAEDMKGKPDTETARHMLMLGECFYVTRRYEEARPLLVKALRNLTDESERTIAEYRLACVHYRLNDFAGAMEKIDNFVGRRPDDPRSGTLLVFKMSILAGQGSKAEPELVRLHRQIRDGRRYDAKTGMEADQVLCDFYRRHGQDEKAQEVYIRLVNNFKRVIVDLQAKKQPVPAAFEKSHDNAALQLGVIALERRQPTEAMKWLDNVRYDLELKARAKLLMARIAYERQDIAAAANYLTEGGLIDMVPAGQVKSDMYLMLALCEKAKPDAKAAVVEEHLKRVGPEARGYLQAQSVLGDLYLEKGLVDYAVRAYTQCLASSEWAPHALHKLAEVAIQQAADDPAKAASHYRKAAGYLGELFVKYPISSAAKEARAKVEFLASKGVDVSMAAGGESAIAGWEKLAREKKGSYEAAQALLSLMRAHFKTALNEKKQMTKAPNYAKCAEACDQLLDGKLYQGAGFSPEDWQAIRGEVLFHRAMCELASVAPTPPKPGEAVPAYVSKANVERAIEWFEQARALVDRKQLEMVKSLELGLLEALFKSEKPQRREQAERRLAEVEADYGTDPRFQRLAINLGEWYAQQGRYAEAARQYRSVAERAKNLPDDELLKLYFNAGALFAQAAYEQQKTDTSTICIYIYPKAVVEVGDDVLRTAPFQRPVNIRWPADGQGITAGEALLELSRRTAIPFVWLSAPGPNTIASYLAEKTVNLKNGQYTAAQALAMILDPEHHRVAEDIGLADGKPTLDKERLAREDPDAAREWQLIEIYDERQIAARYKPLGKSYGSFQQHHRQGELLFDILERIEHLVGARILWTENIDSERQKELLAKEFRAVPGRSGTAELSCAEVLTGVLSACDLRWRLIRRQQSAEHYEASNDCYRKAWTIDSKSSFGQRAMFAVALNCFNQREYGKMKRALLTYLKVCDSPSNRYYHEANFWVGWTLEYDRKYREACHYYARAAAERLIIYRPPAGKPLHTREELQKRLSADTQFALFEPVSGEFKDMTLDQFARWVELSARVDTKLDPSVGGMDVKLNRPQFRRVPAFDVLCETLEQLGLTYRVENIDPEAAEKAYYRMALVDRRENRMDSALENCERLLERYPQSPRLREIKKLQVDIFRGLRDYRRVLETLDELRRTAKDPAEKRALDNEVAAMYFDLADYRRAAEAFRSALATSLDPAEGYNIRTAYARALFRSGQFKEALAQYKELVKEPAPPLVTMINNLVLFYLKYRAEEALEQEFPDEAYRFILAYEKLNDVQREKLSAADRTRATWIYYVLGLIDLHKGRTEKAIEKFKAAANSPDDSLAGEAGIRLAETHMQRKEYELARAALEYMLISVRAAEASDALVRGTYLLAQCYEKLERPVKAGERYRELVERYPQSPYAELAQKQPAYRLRPDKPEEKPAGQAVGKP